MSRDINPMSISLSQICIELRSEKVTVRHKAFDKLHEVLDSSNDDVRLMLDGKIESRTKWQNLFESAFDGMIMHAQKQMQSQAKNDNKSSVYIAAIQKIVKLSNTDKQTIECSIILEKIFKVFEDDLYVKYYGNCFLQIMETFLSNKRVYLTEIKTRDWHELVKLCFDLHEMNDRIQKIFKLQYLLLVLELGLNHSHLSKDLDIFLPKIEQIMFNAEKGRNEFEAIKIVYLIVENIAVQYRLKVCCFLEKILGNIIGVYDTASDEVKIVIFKLLNLSLILHLDKKGNNVEMYADCMPVWQKHLMNIKNLFKRELNQLQKQTVSRNNNTRMTDIFVKFGANLCLMLYWIDDQSDRSEGTRVVKRTKFSNKLQTIIEFTQSDNDKFCPKWFMILSELLYQYSSICLTSNDYLSILKLLVNIQGLLGSSAEMKSFYKCCLIMIENENVITQTNMKNTEIYNKHWDNIAHKIFLSIDCYSHGSKLLHLLIKSKKLTNKLGFNIIENYTGNSSKRSNDSVKTLKMILKFSNVMELEISFNTSMKIFNWIYPNLLEENTNSSGNENLQDIALLTILSFSKNINHRIMIDNETEIDDDDVSNYQDRMANIQKLLSLKLLNMPLRHCELNEETKTTGNVETDAETELILTDSTMEIINGIFIQIFSKEENSTKILTIIKSTNLLLIILNILLECSQDDIRIQQCALLPTLEKFIVSMETYFGLTACDKFHSDVIIRILSCLKNLFEIQYNKLIVNLLKSHLFDNTIKWIAKKLKHIRSNDKALLSSICLENCSSQQKLNLLAIELMIHLHRFNNSCVENIFDQLSEYYFNTEQNYNLIIIFTSMKVIFRCQNSCEYFVSWVLEMVKKICQQHHKNQFISETIIDLIPNLIDFIKDYSNDRKNIYLVLKSFMVKCCRGNYSPSLAIKLINHSKYIFEVYYDDVHQDIFGIIIDALSHSLHSQMLEIQLAAIETLGYIFSKNKKIRNFTECLNYESNCLELFDKIKLQDLSISEEDVDDVRQNKISQAIHCFTTLFCTYRLARNSILFLLAKFCYKNNITSDIIKPLISHEFFTNDDSIENLVEKNMPYVIEKWIENNFPIANFPWFLTTSLDHKEFVATHSSMITMSILKYGSDNLKGFALESQESVKQLLTPVLAECITILIPFYIQSNDNKFSSEIHQLLTNEFGEEILNQFMQHNTYQLIIHLVKSYWDSNEFEQCFIFYNPKLNDDSDEHFTLDNQKFSSCLQFLNKFSKHPKADIFTSLCIYEPFSVIIILNLFKEEVHNFIKDVDIFKPLHKFFMLLNLMSNFLQFPLKNEEIEKIKAYFIRDLCLFLLNVILQPAVIKEIKLVILQQLKNFCSKNFQRCTNHFKPLLNIFVLKLVSIIKDNKTEEITEIGLKILQFFIIDNVESMATEIALIDVFPDDKKFAEFRKISNRIKYGAKEFKLLDEIEHFLIIDNRGIESIIHLNTILATKKEELAELYNRLPETNANLESNVLHKLTFKLIQLVKSPCKQMSVEAAKCLGELGPADLTTMGLKTNQFSKLSTETLSSFVKATESLCSVIVKTLYNLLTEFDVHLVKASCEALYFLMKNKFCKKYILELKYLRVFHQSHNDSCEIFSINKAIIPQQLKTAFLPHKKFSHSKWIKELACELLEYFQNKVLRNIVLLHDSLAELILPLLVQLLLSLRDKHINCFLGECVHDFFERHCDEFSKSAQNLKSIYMNKQSIKSMLQVVDCIRIYNQSFPNKIELNYLGVAKAAQFCDAFPSSILYAEIWAMNQLNDHNKTSEELKNTEFKDIMIEAYQALEEMDAIKPFLDLVKSRDTYFMLEQSWNRVFLENDVDRTLKLANDESYRNNLQNSGLYYLANMFQSQTGPNFECAWRLGDWSLIGPNGENSSHDVSLQLNFERNHYLSLKFLQKHDENSTKHFITKSRNTVIDMFKKSNPEYLRTIYKYMKMLQFIQQIEDFSDIQFNKGQNGSYQRILFKWQMQDQIPYNNFDHKESIIAQRIAILASSSNKEENSWITKTLQNTLLYLAREARNFGYSNVAIRNLKHLDCFHLTPDLEGQVLLENAQLSWSSGDSILTKQLFQNLINQHKFENTLSKIVALRLYGEYLTENRTEDPIVIHDKYLEISQKLIGNYTSQSSEESHSSSQIKMAQQEKFKAFQSIAKFADNIYTQRDNYIKSSEYDLRKKLMEKTKKEAEIMKTKSQTPQDTANAHILMKNVIIDCRDLKNVNEDREYYLTMAVDRYIICCIMNSEIHDLYIFRIISLWFMNIFNAKITDVLKKNLSKIPSYKFLCVLPQIAARLSQNNYEFATMVFDILERCCIDHPHHSLNHLLALVNAYKDNPSIQLSSSSIKRVDNACFLLEKLKENKQTLLIVKELERMISALIELANVSEIKKIPLGNPLLKMELCNYVQFLTVELPININCVYQNLTYTMKWKPEIEHVGGINAPKRLYCVCSDGKTRSFLLKGKDDLRQDAVMQQVFHFMNTLLKSKKETFKRKLSIRTYKIVPLTQISGLLEWCENTLTLANYLAKPKGDGAHKKYRPQDYTVPNCRKLIADSATKNNDIRLSVYMEVCKNFKPVLQHFLTDYFFNPGDWFEKRLAYINSVATTSMVGYILGIGDRHVNNLLLDKSTAEVIHIDFGIAFEKGKILPTPETVPFRLTRDIVAAMGVFGVDGIFRKSCELTMEVLRQNQTIINTILEVLLYDPLYCWANNQKRLKSLDLISSEDDTEEIEEKNSSAARALLRVNAKLNGRDESTNAICSVETQVERLIQQAMNPSNLSRMFHGWQAYL